MCKLVSIMLSCVWFGHPLTGEQWIGAVRLFFNFLSFPVSVFLTDIDVALTNPHYFNRQVIVFGALYTRSFLKRKPHKLTTIPVHGGNLNQSNGNPWLAFLFFRGCWWILCSSSVTMFGYLLWALILGMFCLVFWVVTEGFVLSSIL